MDIHTSVLSTKKPPVFGIDNQLFGDSQEKRFWFTFLRNCQLRGIYMRHNVMCSSPQSGKVQNKKKTLEFNRLHYKLTCQTKHT